MRLKNVGIPGLIFALVTHVSAEHPYNPSGYGNIFVNDPPRILFVVLAQDQGSSKSQVLEAPSAGAPATFEPPPFADLPDPIDFPLDPPDPWDDPFDPINDLPLPDVPDFPPELPPCGEDDFPLPDPPILDDPFPDLEPSLFPGDLDSGEQLGYVNRPEGAARNDAAVNRPNGFMPYPQRLPFPPVVPSLKNVKTDCNPASSAHLVFSEDAKTTLAFIDSCHPASTQRVNVGAKPGAVAITPDGSRVLVTLRDKGTVAVVDTANRTVIKNIALPTYHGANAQPSRIVILPDGSRAYVTSHVAVQDAPMYVIDMASLEVISTISVGAFPSGLRVTPDGSQVWVSSVPGSAVFVIDTLTNAITWTISNIPYAAGIAFNPIGTRAFITEAVPGGGFLDIVDTGTYLVKRRIPVGNEPIHVIVSPTGRQAFVTNFLSKYMSVISTETGQEIQRVDIGKRAKLLTFMPR
jgi:YVTN family beta-propeller protein